MIIGNIIAVMIIAAIPWALALPVLRWHPAMQTAQARRTYRLATYGIAFAFSAVSFVVPALGMVWFIPLGAAIWLDIKWFNLSRTRKGRAALAFAKVEAKPPAPLPPPRDYDPWFRPGVMAVPVPATGPIPVNPPAGWYPHDGVQRWWDGAAWTEHIRPG